MKQLNPKYWFFVVLLCCNITLVSSLDAQTLFSTTYNGGTYGAGTISKYVSLTNTISAAFNFDNADGVSPYYSRLVQATNGKLYGMTRDGGSNNNGSIFSYDPVTATYAKVKDFD